MIPQALLRALRSPWLHPLNDIDAIDDWLAMIRPRWSLSRIRARITGIRSETPDTKTFELKPNWRWPGFAAGQHVAVELEIDGARHHRPFSLSSGPDGRDIAVTVKRSGRFTGVMHDQLRIGDVLTLTGPAGGFVLPATLPERLLLVAAGVGMTPLLSILRDLAARRHEGSVVLVQVYRQAQLFARELAELATRLPGLVVHLYDTSTEGRLGVPALVGSLDPETTDAFLCGPPAFMASIQAAMETAMQAANRLGPRVLVERFAPEAPLPGADGPQVHALRSGVRFTASGGPLLGDAEAAGLRPRHGCRVGLCQNCVVRKRTGTVVDLRSGRTSAACDEPIQLCVFAACSDLGLDL